MMKSWSVLPAMAALACMTSVSFLLAGEVEPTSVMPDAAGMDQIRVVSHEEVIVPTITKDEEDKEKDLIDVDIEDASLSDVVSMIARMSDKSIVWPATNLNERVKAKITRTPWKAALSQILDQHGYALIEKEQGIYSIASKAEIGPQILTRAFDVKYTTLDSAKMVVQNMLVEGGSISDVQGQNIFVVRSTSENLTSIGEILKMIDKPLPQVCIEAKFMELNESAVEKLGIRWDALEEFGATLNGVRFMATEDLIKNKARSDSMSQWDNRTRQDSIGNYYDKDNVQFEERSTTWQEVPPGSGSYSPVTVLTPTRVVEDVIQQGRNVQQEIVESFGKTIEETQVAVLDVDSLRLVLSALKTTDGVRIISNPKILVTSGDTNAVFYVGQKEPIITKEITRGTTESPGDKETAKLDVTIATDTIKGGFIETGIKLLVKPVVRTEDRIEATIEPKLTRKLSDKVVSGNSWPVISVKEIKTKFTLRSGQTVAIGGLTDTMEGKTVSKIPLLGDIPLIGKYLFSHRETTKEQRETIIFVSLTLADPSELRGKEGIPEDAELVHKTLIRRDAERRRFEGELERIQESEEVLRAKDQEKMRRLLRKGS